MAPPFRSHLGLSGNFNRTLWHEVGHYLGVDRDVKGRAVNTDALEENSSALEEMKSDLVALYLGQALRERALLRRHHPARAVRERHPARAADRPPARDQPYQTMQLMQMNYFLENGLLEANPDGLSIHYEKYHDVVGKLLREVLAIQRGRRQGGVGSVHREVHPLGRVPPRRPGGEDARPGEVPLHAGEVRGARRVAGRSSSPARASCSTCASPRPTDGRQRTAWLRWKTGWCPSSAAPIPWSMRPWPRRISRPGGRRALCTSSPSAQGPECGTPDCLSSNQ